MNRMGCGSNIHWDSKRATSDNAAKQSLDLLFLSHKLPRNTPEHPRGRLNTSMSDSVAHIKIRIHSCILLPALVLCLRSSSYMRNL